MTAPSQQLFSRASPGRVAPLLDVLWLVALAVFVYAGMMLAPFHGDEAMHIYTSHDYATAFLNGQTQSLTVSPPYDIDSVPRLRLLNGSVMRYSIGLSWYLAGLSENDLPPHPGWDWGQYYANNAETGHRPSEALLHAGRIVSVIYLVGSIAAMFGMGWQFGGRPLAYFVSLVYTLNPIILLNGRRALVESALLCFGLLTIWVALMIAHKREAGGKGLWGWWLALIVTSALTLASKYSGTIFVAGAFGGLFIAESLRFLLAARRPHSWKQAFPPLLTTTLKLLVSGLAALALLIALSPALWNDPVARARDLATMLQEQVDIVVSIQPDAPTTIPQRIEGTVTQSFMSSVAFFEQASWADAAPITAEINTYMASPLSGLQFGTVGGLLLTLLAGIGVVAVVWPNLRPYRWISLSAVLLSWLLVIIANLMINPLPWQRYYLPLIPATSLLTGIGLLALVRLLRQRSLAK